ncbi:MAG TPA: UDP-N-acetylmuramoyl-tripeptide--D-alanyl-D-alanine ligase [Candidatus Binataceae bacterium]|nr:UDP-N-acetylmuramoyl-tripeptide--D-alanyl-D-alanine ligase [Candidatus Binataceae bacterium]
MATPIPDNQCKFSVAEIVEAASAIFHGDPSLRIDGVSVDSRKIRPHQLFVALRGVHDGHDFIDEAARLEASAAIVERGRSSPKLPCFEVDDTLIALGQLAAYHLERTRKHHQLPVIAIGGAAGKTTTKELTAAIARALFGEVLATTGNLNNLIGVPMTLLTLTDADRAAVIECGTNRPGEIARLARIVRPDVSLVLNVDIEHTEGLGSLEGVADEEAALFTTAKIAVTGAGEAMLRERIPAGLPTVTFGDSPLAAVRLLNRKLIAPGRQRISIGLPPTMIEPDLRLDTAVSGPCDDPEPLFEFPLNLIGNASALNAAAAIAAVVAAAERPLSHAQLIVIDAALETVKPVPGRLATRELHDLVVIDDTYNANPRSVRAALDAARETADALSARLLIVLGDMLELGELSAAMHIGVLRGLLHDIHPDLSLLVGSEFAAAAKTVASIPDSGYDPNRIAFAADSATAARAVRSLVKPGDVLLVKGSRGIAMEKVIDALE